MKIIQQIYIGDGNSIFLIDFDEEKTEISFRNSIESKLKQTEQISIDEKGMIHLGPHFFHQTYLAKWLSENNIN